MGMSGLKVVASVSTFTVLAMVLFPDMQLKAQEEILLKRSLTLSARAVFQTSPTVSTCRTFPLCTRAARRRSFWSSHSTTQGDWYGDYFVPKGSLVLSNL